MTATFPLSSALAVAQYIVQAIQPACHRMEIAGSIRRKQPQVHDVDIVAWPVYTEEAEKDLFGNQTSLNYWPEDIIQILSSFQKVIELGFARMNPKIIKTIYSTIPVEIYLTEPDGSNFGALCQLRTGSREFNQTLATNAKVKGLHYKAGYGVFNQEGHRLDDDSEKRIIEICGGKFVEPEKRR